MDCIDNHRIWINEGWGNGIYTELGIYIVGDIYRGIYHILYIGDHIIISNAIGNEKRKWAEWDVNKFEEEMKWMS